MAMIAYVGSETDNATYKHGLALALADESDRKWTDAKTVCSDKNTSLPVAGASWLLPSKAQWETMISAAGGYTALRVGFSSVGGTNLLTDAYWSSTECDSGNAWYFGFGNSVCHYHIKDGEFGIGVRACLVF